MVNRSGKTVQERLETDIEYAEKIGKDGECDVLAVRALGMADLAVDFGLISYSEWERYIKRIFQII